MSTVLQCQSRIIINEFARESVSVNNGDIQRLQVEFHNPTNCAFPAAELIVRFGGEAYLVSAVPVEANGYRVFELVVSGTLSDCAECDQIELARASDFSVLDRAPVPKTNVNTQYAGRVPNGIGRFALEDRSELTLGLANVDQGPVVRLTDAGGFPPRDSSPNAIVQHGGAYWILGGWGNHGHDLWYSIADVWKSEDGVNWRLINAEPPYSPYSSFIVFRERIWAIGRTSYSSADGILWRPEQLEFALTSRAVVFDEAIIGVIGERVLRSIDGVSWTPLAEHAPWGPYRVEQQLLVHNDRLWLIGGTDEPTDGPLVYRNDVWSSADGVNWVRVTAAAAWAPRRWLNAISHAGKLWVLNGANFDAWPDQCNNTADIWLSDDGAHWRQIQTEKLWGARHASFVVPDLEGGFLLAAGYGNCGVERMYADVWHVEYRLSMDTAAGGTPDAPR
jgi:hypothetical protein